MCKSESEPYRPGQVFFSNNDLDRIKRQEISPALTKFDKKTGHTHVEAPSGEQKGNDAK